MSIECAPKQYTVHYCRCATIMNMKAIPRPTPLPISCPSSCHYGFRTVVLDWYNFRLHLQPNFLPQGSCGCKSNCVWKTISQYTLSSAGSAVIFGKDCDPWLMLCFYNHLKTIPLVSFVVSWPMQTNWTNQWQWKKQVRGHSSEHVCTVNLLFCWHNHLVLLTSVYHFWSQ